MLRQKTRVVFSRLSKFSAAFVLAFVMTLNVLSHASAAGVVTERSVAMSTAAAGATGASYTFSFKPFTTGNIGSIKIDICDTADTSNSCTHASSAANFSGSSATLGSTTIPGSGWAIGALAQYTLKAAATSASSATSGVAYNIVFSNLTNPDAANSTFFLWITTYQTTSYGTQVDTGTVAASTAGQITVTGTIYETLTFTLTSATVSLTSTGGSGVLVTGQDNTGTSTMQASTNAAHGYNITIGAGSTADLTSGSNHISALSSPTAHSVNASQFGLNLVDNATPNVGSNPSSGSGSAATGYATADSFKYAPGDTVASSSGASNTTTFTVSYLANVSASQAAGVYSATVDYICTPIF